MSSMRPVSFKTKKTYTDLRICIFQFGTANIPAWNKGKTNMEYRITNIFTREASFCLTMTARYKDT